MRVDEEDEPKVAAKVPGGILSAMCCTCCKTWSPRKRIYSDQGISNIAQNPTLARKLEEVTSNVEDYANLTVTRIPGLSIKNSSIKSEVGHQKETWLEIPSGSEIWSPPSGDISNWDFFFKSQASTGPIYTESTKTDNDELFMSAVLDSGSPNSGEVIDCEAIDSGIWQPALAGSLIEQNTKLSDSSGRRGEIFLTYMSKMGMRYTSVPWDIRIEEIATWLNKGSTPTIPISRDITPKRLMVKNFRNFPKLTLLEIFGDRLDPEKAGITFFMGPVEGKLSFKMSVCNLKLLQRAIRKNRDHLKGECAKVKYVS